MEYVEGTTWSTGTIIDNRSWSEEEDLFGLVGAAGAEAKDVDAARHYVAVAVTAIPLGADTRIRFRGPSAVNAGFKRNSSAGRQ